MPLVRIDHSDARTNPTEIATAIHDAIVSVYGIPERDRFQVITSRPATTIIAEDAGLGFERTDPVIIQIFTQRGRATDQKQRLYAAIADALEPVGVARRTSSSAMSRTAPRTGASASGARST